MARFGILILYDPFIFLHGISANDEHFRHREVWQIQELLSVRIQILESLAQHQF